MTVLSGSVRRRALSLQALTPAADVAVLDGGGGTTIPADNAPSRSREAATASTRARLDPAASWVTFPGPTGLPFLAFTLAAVVGLRWRWPGTIPGGGPGGV